MNSPLIRFPDSKPPPHGSFGRCVIYTHDAWRIDTKLTVADWLSLEVYKLEQHFIRYGDDPCIGLKSALGGDHIGKLF